MARPRRGKTTKERLEEAKKEYQKWENYYLEEITGKAYRIFEKNKLEYLLDDENYLKILEEMIIKSADEYNTSNTNNNI